MYVLKFSRMSVSRFSWKSQLYVKNCYNESDEKTKNGLVADNGSQTYIRMDRWTDEKAGGFMPLQKIILSMS